MYLLTITLEDPISGTSRAIRRQIEPLAFDQSTWNRALPDVQAILADIVAMAPDEPKTL